VLACGFGDHVMGSCPTRRTRDVAPIPLAVTPVPLALAALPARGNSRPIGKKVPLPTQQQAFDQAQGGARSGARHRRDHDYHLTTEKAEA